MHSGRLSMVNPVGTIKGSLSINNPVGAHRCMPKLGQHTNLIKTKNQKHLATDAVIVLIVPPASVYLIVIADALGTYVISLEIFYAVHSYY